MHTGVWSALLGGKAKQLRVVHGVLLGAAAGRERRRGWERRGRRESGEGGVPDSRYTGRACAGFAFPAADPQPLSAASQRTSHSGARTTSTAPPDLMQKRSLRLSVAPKAQHDPEQKNIPKRPYEGTRISLACPFLISFFLREETHRTASALIPNTVNAVFPRVSAGEGSDRP